MTLSAYNKKRNLKDTTEPAGLVSRSEKPLFVVQRHESLRLHYDLRLELDGVLKSWAVPKGPSLYPADKRLAMLVEDHPVGYATFKGIIPEGHYGAGKVAIWDKGTVEFVNEQHRPLTNGQAKKWLKNGQLKMRLKGKKLKGEFALVQLKKDETGKAWLLIKHKDEHASSIPYNSEDHIR